MRSKAGTDSFLLIGSFFDNGTGVLSGTYNQVPSGYPINGSGAIDYQNGAWSLNFPEVFLEGAVISYSYVVSEMIDYAVYAAPIPKTGQTTSYGAGDDGEFRFGLAWPSPRFTYEVDSGVVVDVLTGLMWAQAPHALDGNLTFHNWTNALNFCNSLETGGFTDWRLPNRRELFSLIDDGNHAPALPSGHPFTGIRQGLYWSSTTTDNPAVGWSVGMELGNFGYDAKTATLSVWPVRGPVPAE